MKERNETVIRRARRARIKIRRGNRDGRPRLSVFRSSKYIYAQIIDDSRGHTLHAASSLEKEFREQNRGATSKCDREAARRVGKMLAKRAVANGLRKVVFDRGGYAFHGRVLALAEGAREAGLEF